MKKKSAKSIPPNEMIHFYPGEVLGRTINKFAARWRTSRGDATRRLVVQALGSSVGDSQPTGPKRRLDKSIRPAMPIHFHPPQALGLEIAEHATDWKVSRGEACKQLALLAVHDLDVGFHPIAAELAQCRSDAAKFEMAVACIHTRIIQVTRKRSDTDHPVLWPSDRLEIARELLHPYKFIKDIEDETERQRQVVYQRR